GERGVRKTLPIGVAKGSLPSISCGSPASPPSLVLGYPPRQNGGLPRQAAVARHMTSARVDRGRRWRRSGVDGGGGGRRGYDRGCGRGLLDGPFLLDATGGQGGENREGGNRKAVHGGDPPPGPPPPPPPPAPAPHLGPP